MATILGMLNTSDQIPSRRFDILSGSLVALGLSILLLSETPRISNIGGGESSVSTAVQGATTFIGFLAVSTLLLRLTGKWGRLLPGLSLAGLLALTLLWMGHLAGNPGGHEFLNLSEVTGGVLVSSALLAIFVSNRLGYLRREPRNSQALPWGLAVVFGLFAVPFLHMFTSSPIIDLGLIIRHHTAWKGAALHLLFIDEALTGALIGFAFTWLGSQRRVAYLLAASELIYGFIVFLWILKTPWLWIVRYPWIICSEPLGLLAGGWLAIRWMTRNALSPDAEKEDQLPA